MSDSIWKKEISLGRKKTAPEEPVPDAVAPPAGTDGPRESVWTKMASLLKKMFGRKPKAAEPPKPAAAEAAQASPPAPIVPAVPTAASEQAQSVWKKEISFGRKPKADAPPAQAAPPVQADAAVPAEPAVAPESKQSVWKKDISFGRKPKAEALAAAAAVEAARPEDKQSVWKKEISFGRKKQDKELDRITQEAAQSVSPSFAPTASAPVPPPAEVRPTVVAEAFVAAMPEPAAPAPWEAPEQAPELEQPAPVELPVAPPPVPEAPPLSVPAPLEPLPTITPVLPVALHVAPEPPAPEPPSLAPEPVEALPFELAAVSGPLEPVPDLQPLEPAALEPAPPLEAVHADPAPVAPMPAGPVSDEPAPVDATPLSAVPELPLDPVPAVKPDQVPADPAPADAALADVVPPDPVEAAPVSTLSPAILAASAEIPRAAPFESPASPEPVPLEPVALEPVALEPEPVQPEPVLPDPAPVAEAAVAADVAADPWLASSELPPEPGLPAPAVLHPPVPAAELAPVVEAKVPFWKKDLSLSRKKTTDFSAVEAAVAAAAVVDVAGAPAAKVPWWKKEIGGKKKAAPAEIPTGFEEFDLEKKPFWKKDLSLSRKRKPAVTAVDAAVVAVAVADATGAPVAKAPWWKKEIGGKKKAVPAADEAAPAPAPAAPKAPVWKKQLAMPSLSMPSLSRGGGRSSGGGAGKSHKGAKKLVGLKIGASQLAAARVSNNGVAELEQVARQELPMGIVVGGELRDPDALSEALKAFFAKNKLPRKGVRLGIANNRIGVRIFDIAGVEDEKQLVNAIHFRAQEALPIALDEAVLDYHVLDETADPEGKPVKRVLLVVAYRELIDRYVDACQKAGITLAGIDLEAFALLRSLSPPAERTGLAVVAVSVGYDRSTFAVSDGQFCEFTRVLEWGGAKLNIALADAFNSAPSAVEVMKRGLSLDGSTAPEGISAESNAKAVDVVRKQVQLFQRELVASLQFYQNQPGSLGIGEIVITGGTAQMPGLAEELERLIGVHVRVGNPLARLKVSKRVALSPEQAGSLAVAIGLGIED